MQEEIVDETDEYVDVHKRYHVMYILEQYSFITISALYSLFLRKYMMICCNTSEYAWLPLRLLHQWQGLHHTGDWLLKRYYNLTSKLVPHITSNSSSILKMPLSSCENFMQRDKILLKYRRWGIAGRELHLVREGTQYWPKALAYLFLLRLGYLVFLSKHLSKHILKSHFQGWT